MWRPDKGNMAQATFCGPLNEPNLDN